MHIFDLSRRKSFDRLVRNADGKFEYFAFLIDISSNKSDDLIKFLS